MRLNRSLLIAFFGLVAAAIGLWLLVGSSNGRVKAPEAGGLASRPADAVGSASVVSGCVRPPRAGDGTTLFGRVHFYDNGIDQGDKVQSSRQADGTWSAKQGLVIKGADTVVVRIPASARPSVVISAWGTNNGKKTMRVARIQHDEAPCSGNKWAAYAGGFDFRGKQCLRLRVEVDGRTAKVPFGLGKVCN